MLEGIIVFIVIANILMSLEIVMYVNYKRKRLLVESEDIAFYLVMSLETISVLIISLCVLLG